MNQPDPVAVAMDSTGAAPPAAASPAPTPLCAALGVAGAEAGLHCGALTPRSFGNVDAELDALLHAAGISDLGYRGRIRVTGGDRLRWLNGMVSNAVQALPENHGNYSFLLSVQGRIQGDCFVYRRGDDLLLDTGLDQVATLLSHLEHFIIMDDVELADVSQEYTAISLAGPAARAVLDEVGIALPAAAESYARMSAARIGEADCLVIEAQSLLAPRFEVWCARDQVLAVWKALQAAGGVPCGLLATEALRVMEATPLYGVDLNDKDLPQEAAQTRALNFSKGCYLGQEIVERIRSRGKVNRQLRQFSLKGTPPRTLPAELLSGGQPVGRITTSALIAGTGRLGLGIIRLEVVERHAEVVYDGGAATVSVTPPQAT